jgi:hypothetical protein
VTHNEEDESNAGVSKADEVAISPKEHCSKRGHNHSIITTKTFLDFSSFSSFFCVSQKERGEYGG